MKRQLFVATANFSGRPLRNDRGPGLPPSSDVASCSSITRLTLDYGIPVIKCIVGIIRDRTMAVLIDRRLARRVDS